jgi:hypothetical protein
MRDMSYDFSQHRGEKEGRGSFLVDRSVLDALFR